MVLPGRIGLGEPHDHAATELGTLVRAAVGEREVFPAHVEEPDLPAARGHDLAPARLDLAHQGYDLAAHCRP
jgi:hypothetical protein